MMTAIANMEPEVRFSPSQALELAEALHAEGFAESSEDHTVEGTVIVRRAIWTSVGGDTTTVALGINRVALTLSQMILTLQDLQTRFSRLYQELVCLDDGDAEVFFGDRGPLGITGDASTCATQAADMCVSTELDLQRCYDELGRTSSVWVELPNPSIVSTTLESGARAIDELQRLVELLTARRQAAVTRARAAIEGRDKIKEPCSPTSSDGSVASNDDCDDSGAESNTGGWCWFGLLPSIIQSASLTTSASRSRLPAWSGAFSSIENLARTLRRHFYVPSSCNALDVLDSLFQSFDELTGVVARLHEETMCLELEDDVANKIHEKQPLPPMLLGATIVQKSALEWKCKLLAKLEGTPDAKAKPKVPVRPFVEFLEEALAVGDVLEAHILEHSKQHEMRVSCLKASVESSAWLQTPMNDGKAGVGS